MSNPTEQPGDAKSSGEGSAHTPGPWTFRAPWAGFSKITGPNDELIFGIAAGGSDEAQPADVCDANARLIAAAPDLLEALRFYVEAEDTGLENDELDRFSELARAAITKATGDPSPPAEELGATANDQGREEPK